jgi:hypothetical protein
VWKVKTKVKEKLLTIKESTPSHLSVRLPISVFVAVLLHIPSSVSIGLSCLQMNVMNVDMVIILLDNYLLPLPVYSTNSNDSADHP